MKKLPLILNIVLAIAIIVLYVLHFSQKKTVNTFFSDADSSGRMVTQMRIAYVNNDTLMMNYGMYRDLSKELESKKNLLEAELAKKSGDYQKLAADYQEKVSKGLVTHYRAQEMEAELLKLQDNLLRYRDELTAKLMEEERVMNNQIIYSITEYLKEYNKDKNLTFIVGNSVSGPFLYVNDSLNITRSVVEGLNAKYELTRKDTKKKK